MPNTNWQRRPRWRAMNKISKAFWSPRFGCCYHQRMSKGNIPVCRCLSWFYVSYLGELTRLFLTPLEFIKYSAFIWDNTKVVALVYALCSHFFHFPSVFWLLFFSGRLISQAEKQNNPNVHWQHGRIATQPDPQPHPYPHVRPAGLASHVYLMDTPGNY